LSRLEDKDLTDIRALQKPDTEIEDLLAAIIIIGKKKIFLVFFLIVLQNAIF